MEAQNQQQTAVHYFRLMAAIITLALTPLVYALFFTYSTPDVHIAPTSSEVVGDFIEVILSDSSVENSVPDAADGEGALVELVIHTFHDLNLDGVQGDPEQEGALVKLYNVEDYSDTRLFEELPLSGEEVSLCYGIVCKTPDANGDIRFVMPLFAFEQQEIIPLWYNFRPGRFVYYTFNTPNTVHGQLEGGNIILRPQYSGSGDINLPTDGKYLEFTIGFSEYPCVLPFDESVVPELLPMNFYDFDSNLGEIRNFDGGVPPTLRDIDPSFGNYNSENHAGLDIYYPRQEQVVRYSCIIPPQYAAYQSSDVFGNFAFIVSSGFQSSEFLVTFGHLQAPEVSTYVEQPLRFGDAFGTVGQRGTSINHLHFAFGYINDSRVDGLAEFCVIPPFPYLSGNPPYPGIMYGTSQLQENLCFDHSHRSYLSFVHDGDTIYAPFVPSVIVEE